MVHKSQPNTVTRRKVIKLTGGSLGLVGLAGCTSNDGGNGSANGGSGNGSANGGSGNGSANGGGGAVDKLTAWAYGPHYTYLEDVANTFDKNSVEAVEQPGSKINTKVISSLTSGSNIPDITTIRQQLNPRLQVEKSVVSVQERMKEYEDKIFPAAKYEGKWTENWRHYPIGCGPMATYYNKDLFSKAGLPTDPKSLEQEIQTWDQFIEAGKTIEKETGAKMLSMSSERHASQMVYATCKQAGGIYYNSDYEFQMDKETNIEAYKKLKEMYDSINAPMGAFGAPYWKAARNGDIATITAPAWIKTWFKNELSDMSGQWGIIRIPRLSEDNNRAANAGASAAVIPKAINKDRYDPASEFGEYWHVSEAGYEAKLAVGSFPAVDYKDNKLRKEGGDYFKDQNYVGLLSEIANDVPVAYSPPTDSAKQGMYEATNRVLQRNESPEKALSEVNSSVKGSLSDVYKTAPVKYSK